MVNDVAQDNVPQGTQPGPLPVRVGSHRWVLAWGIGASAAASALVVKVSCWATPNTSRHDAFSVCTMMPVPNHHE